MLDFSPARPHSAVIFDLDGVLVDTADLHLKAWTELAARLGFVLPAPVGDRLRGVGRLAALDLVLACGGVRTDDVDVVDLAARKNSRYLELLQVLDAGALLPGARASLDLLRELGIPIALASASRNARSVLSSTGIERCFDVIVDGTVVAEAKPDPRVFLVAAAELGVPAEQAVVVEDAPAGVAGARAAGMFVIGVGRPSLLPDADTVVRGLDEINWRTLLVPQSAPTTGAAVAR